MIEIKSVRDLDEKVSVNYKDLIDIMDFEIKALEAIGNLKRLVLERYVENYACFGNGGTITYEELAKVLGIKVPKVAHVGVSQYLKIKREVENEREEDS